MKNRIKQKRSVSGLCFFLFTILFMSCQQDIDKYYEIPDWLKGTSRDILVSQGNYSLFLEAVDRAGYSDLLGGKGIITVAAPSDHAFKAWLDSHGYASIASVPLDELTKVVAYHFVYYSYDKAMFANYSPQGSTVDPEALNSAGLYYKFRTKSNDVITQHYDYTVAEETSKPIRKVYHKERFLPVFSSFIFQTKGIDPVYNYTYFYPTSTWNGDGGGFNISNASVDEYAIVADNGYVYIIDKVLEPLETIYTELTKSTNNSVFLKMYDRFTDFTYDAATTTNYGKGDSLFLYYHRDLPKIASEWTYNGENASMPDYANLRELTRTAYNVFAPSDQALQTFFNSFWGDYYTSIDEVAFLPVKYLLDNHVYEGNVVFPEEIVKGKITTSFGNKIEFDPQNTNLKKMCVNGTLYGLNALMVPRMFESVTAPAFQNPDYTVFLQMLNDADLVLPLMSQDITSNLFIPSDKLILDNTTLFGNALFYQNTNPNKYGDQDILIESTDGKSSMSYSQKSYFARNHIGTALLTEVGNLKIYKTMNSYQYLLVEDNNKIYSTNIYNNYNDRPADLKKIYSAYNGTTYEISGSEAMALLPDENLFKDQITKMPETSPFYYFRLLVETSGLHLTSPSFSFLQGERFIAFIPTSSAILSGFSQIPSDPKEMAQYLKYYFVNTNESSLGDYPFPGAGIQGQATTFYQSNGRNAKLTIIDNGSQLQVKDEKGNVVNVVGVFPSIYGDGAAYLIDGLLDYNN